MGERGLSRGPQTRVIRIKKVERTIQPLSFLELRTPAASLSPHIVHMSSEHMSEHAQNVHHGCRATYQDRSAECLGISSQSWLEVPEYFSFAQHPGNMVCWDIRSLLPVASLVIVG